MRNYLQIASASLLGAAMPLLAISRGLFFAAIIFSALLGLSSLKLSELKSSIKSVFTANFAKVIIPLFAVLGLSVVFSIDVDYSVKKLTDLAIVFVVVALLAIPLASFSKDKIELCLKVLTGLTVVNLLFLCFDMFIASKDFLIAFHGEENIGPGRVRYPASQIAVVAPLVFGYLYYLKSKKLLAYIFMAFLFAVIVATGGRSALLSIVVGCCFMFMVMAFYAKRLPLKEIIVSLAIFIGLFFLGLQGYKTLDQRSGLNQYEVRMTAGSSDLSSGRFEIWKFAWEKSLEKPFLGFGPGGYRTLTADPELVLPAKNHPHNFVLEILVSTGFIGLLVVGLILLYLFINYFTYGAGFAVFAMGSFVVFWVNSLTSVSIIQTYWVAVFAVSFVIGYYTIKKEKN